MAFVSQSPRQILGGPATSTNNIGPGDYTSDLNTLSKSTSVKRKQPAFGAGEERKLNKTTDNTKATPGPGQYLSHVELASAIYDKKLDDNNSYIQYAFQSAVKETALLNNNNNAQSKEPTPGPGYYEINHSSFSNINHLKGFPNLRKKNSLNGQIYHKGAMSGFLNLSIPSIPSRYIQPNLEADENDFITGDGQFVSHSDNILTNGKVKIITNDNSRLGPGAYYVSDSIIKKQSPRGNVNFGASKTLRTADDSFVKKTTTNTVGPGSYEITKELDRKIYNPTIPRDGIGHSNFTTNRGNKRRNQGSIKDNYDVDSQDEGESESDSAERRKREKQMSPGPGQYLSETQINILGKDASRPQQFQFFGSSTERFRAPLTCTNGLGPGAYSQEQREERNKHFQNAGSSSFMGIGRQKNLMLNKTRLEIPGPGDYKLEESIQFLKDSKLIGAQPFKSSVDRFKIRDEAIPGPGKYPLPSSLTIRSSSQVHASFKSTVKKELVFPMDKDIPGAGQYNPQNFKSIGIQKITGGAPNNFSLLAKKSLNNSQIRGYQSPEKERLDISPRAIINEISTPAALGPGYYGGTKFKILEGQPKLIPDSKMFGRVDRFPDLKQASPGPGAYNELNKWHQKTYNLKFLNVVGGSAIPQQMSPQASNTPSSL